MTENGMDLRICFFIAAFIRLLVMLILKKKWQNHPHSVQTVPINPT